MQKVLTIGPVAIPAAQLALMLGLIGLAYGVERWSRRRDGGDGSWVWIALLLGFLSARIAFVLAHWTDFAPEPATLFAVWNGGFSLPWGLIGAATYTLWRYIRIGKSRQGIGLVALLAGLFTIGGALLQNLAPSGAPLPAMVLPSLTGTQQSLQGFAGRPVVLNLWASWCPPCRAEMPLLAQAQRDNPDIALVFVNQGESSQQIDAFLESMQLQLDNVLIDAGGKVATHFISRALPTTLFFDAQGEMVAQHVGGLSRAVLNDYLSKLRAP